VYLHSFQESKRPASLHGGYTNLLMNKKSTTPFYQSQQRLPALLYFSFSRHQVFGDMQCLPSPYLVRFLFVHFTLVTEYKNTVLFVLTLANFILHIIVFC